jgi:hypothetical protein
MAIGFEAGFCVLVLSETVLVLVIEKNLNLAKMLSITNLYSMPMSHPYRLIERARARARVRVRVRARIGIGMHIDPATIFRQ